MSKFFIQVGLYSKAKMILLNMKTNKLDDKNGTAQKLLNLVNTQLETVN